MKRLNLSRGSRTLSIVINELPNVTVTSSDEGLEEAARKGLPWDVIFHPRFVPDLSFFLSLERLASLQREAYAAGFDVELTCNAPPPHLNGPGESLYFVLRGRSGSPTQFAGWLSTMLVLQRSEGPSGSDQGSDCL